MAQGEKTFSSDGRDVSRFDRSPLRAGEWTGKFHSSKAEIGKKNDPGAIPYVKNVYFEALDSATEEGGSNKRVYQMFFLMLTPGKDGKLMPERQGQIIDLAQAVGVRFDGGVVTTKNSQGQTVEYLNPKDVVKYLQSLDGELVKFRSKIKKGTGGYDDSATVDYFIANDDAGQLPDEFGEGEDVAAQPAEEEAPVEETEAEVAEEAAEEEPEPTPVPVKRTAPKAAPAKVTPIKKPAAAAKRR
jgi:hypothetical protein